MQIVNTKDIKYVYKNLIAVLLAVHKKIVETTLFAVAD